MLETKVYKEFCDDVKKVIFDSEKFQNSKIKLFVKQMSIGKSFFMGRKLPSMLKKAFPELGFIIRISPTTEVAEDDFLEAIEYIKTSEGFGKNAVKYRPKKIVGRTSLNLAEDLPDFLDSGNVYVFSLTHARFALEFETFLKHADRSVLVIEEAHQCVAVGDPGSEKYGKVTGYKSPYEAKIAERLIKWSKINGRIMAFTATATRHHNASKPEVGFDVEGTSEKFRDLFDPCNKLAPLKDLLETQAWIDKITSYDFVMGGKNGTKHGAQDSVKESVYSAIDSLFKREKKLKKLKQKDPNIETKLTGLFMCGQGKGVWGCPIHANKHYDEGMVEIISDYLLSLGFSENIKMIATLQEDGSGGNRIWDLSGSAPDTKVSFEEIREKMLDPDDPLRYLIVINRARSGISIMNLGAMVVGVVRDPQVSRTYIPLQIFGRMLRGNPGTGTRFTKKYYNNHYYYLENYSKDSGVDINTIIETYKLSNKFDIWYPVDTDRKTLDVWGDAINDLKKDYCNDLAKGLKWLYDEMGIKPDLETSNFISNYKSVSIIEELLCPHCGEDIAPFIRNKMGDGTLLPFFE